MTPQQKKEKAKKKTKGNEFYQKEYAMKYCRERYIYQPKNKLEKVGEIGLWENKETGEILLMKDYQVDMRVGHPAPPLGTWVRLETFNQYRNV